MATDKDLVDIQVKAMSKAINNCFKDEMKAKTSFYEEFTFIIKTAMGALVIYAIYSLTSCSMDPTDKDWNTRSGMTHHIDYETGVHYLSVRGQLIPRLNADGSVYVDGQAANDTDKE